MSERSFAKIAAEMEGDAPVGAGVRSSDYATRMAPKKAGAAPQQAVQRFDRELDELIGEIRTSVHEAWTASGTSSLIQLEVSLIEGVWRMRLVERRGGEEIKRLAISEATTTER